MIQLTDVEHGMFDESSDDVSGPHLEKFIEDKINSQNKTFKEEKTAKRDRIQSKSSSPVSKRTGSVKRSSITIDSRSPSHSNPADIFGTSCGIIGITRQKTRRSSVVSLDSLRKFYSGNPVIGEGGSRRGSLTQAEIIEVFNRCKDKRERIDLSSSFEDDLFNPKLSHRAATKKRFTDHSSSSKIFESKACIQEEPTQENIGPQGKRVRKTKRIGKCASPSVSSVKGTRSTEVGLGGFATTGSIKRENIRDIPERKGRSDSDTEEKLRERIESHKTENFTENFGVKNSAKSADVCCDVEEGGMCLVRLNGKEKKSKKKKKREDSHGKKDESKHSGHSLGNGELSGIDSHVKEGVKEVNGTVKGAKKQTHKYIYEKVTLSQICVAQAGTNKKPDAHKENMNDDAHQKRGQRSSVENDGNFKSFPSVNQRETLGVGPILVMDISKPVVKHESTVSSAQGDQDNYSSSSSSSLNDNSDSCNLFTHLNVNMSTGAQQNAKASSITPSPRTSVTFSLNGNCTDSCHNPSLMKIKSSELEPDLGRDGGSSHEGSTDSSVIGRRKNGNKLCSSSCRNTMRSFLVSSRVEETEQAKVDCFRIIKSGDAMTEGSGGNLLLNDQRDVASIDSYNLDSSKGENENNEMKLIRGEHGNKKKWTDECSEILPSRPRRRSSITKRYAQKYLPSESARVSMAKSMFVENEGNFQDKRANGEDTNMQKKLLCGHKGNEGYIRRPGEVLSDKSAGCESPGSFENILQLTSFCDEDQPLPDETISGPNWGEQYSTEVSGKLDRHKHEETSDPKMSFELSKSFKEVSHFSHQRFLQSSTFDRSNFNGAPKVDSDEDIDPNNQPHNGYELNNRLFVPLGMSQAMVDPLTKTVGIKSMIHASKKSLPAIDELDVSGIYMRRTTSIPSSSHNPSSRHQGRINCELLMMATMNGCRAPLELLHNGMSTWVFWKVTDCPNAPSAMPPNGQQTFKEKLLTPAGPHGGFLEKSRASILVDKLKKIGKSQTGLIHEDYISTVFIRQFVMSIHSDQGYITLTRMGTTKALQVDLIHAVKLCFGELTLKGHFIDFSPPEDRTKAVAQTSPKKGKNQLIKLTDGIKYLSKNVQKAPTSKACNTVSHQLPSIEYALDLYFDGIDEPLVIALLTERERSTFIQVLKTLQTFRSSKCRANLSVQ